MHTLTQLLVQGHSLSWANEDEACVGIIYGQGRGCHLETTGGVAGIWIPLHGALQINSTYAMRQVDRREVAVTACGASIGVTAHGSASWLAILAGKSLWTQLLDCLVSTEPPLVPATYPASIALRRQAIALARTATAVERDVALRAIMDSIAGLQMQLKPLIARCPGRMHAQKLQVFVRLQRVRFFMTAHCDRELDNDVLAGMANYSAHHFLRTFHSVYQETPHAYLVTQRLQKSWKLLVNGQFAITEVALACGFKNASAFSRLFHKRFGLTAYEARVRTPVSTGNRQPDPLASRTLCNANSEHSPRRLADIA